MSKLFMFVCIALFSNCRPVQSQTLSVELIAPTEASQVDERPIVEGLVSDPKSEVWVIVHPLEVSDYWVQPRATVRQGGKWKVKIYIGRPGVADVGKSFEIRAVANPLANIKEGDILDNWPQADAISDVVEVTRR
jgi:hypothetical protein